MSTAYTPSSSTTVRCTKAPGSGSAGACTSWPELVQLGARYPLGHGLRELGCELVHVGQAVGHRDRELVLGRALGHARAHLVGEGELAAQVVGPARADPEV